MDLSEELALIRQRLDALERVLATTEQPGQAFGALVVSGTLPESTDVKKWTVMAVRVDEAEGATPTFTPTGAIFAPGIGPSRSGSSENRLIAVPIRGARFVVIL